MDNPQEIKIGQRVLARNCFGATYTVTKLNKTTAWLEYDTGEMKMVGGKLVPNKYEYKNVPIRILRAA